MITSKKILRKVDPKIRDRILQMDLNNQVHLKVVSVSSLEEEPIVRAKDWPTYRCIIIIREYEFENRS